MNLVGSNDEPVVEEAIIAQPLLNSFVDYFPLIFSQILGIF